jgi:hypothetical protein
VAFLRRGLLAVTIVLAALAAGCGTESSEGDARRAVDRFFAAYEQRNGRRACAELSEEAASALERSERKPCEDAVLGLELTPSKVSGVEVFITSARVDLAASGPVFLDETSLGWKIGAVGCEERPGLPADCELEA